MRRLTNAAASSDAVAAVLSAIGAPQGQTTGTSASDANGTSPGWLDSFYQQHSSGLALFTTSPGALGPNEDPTAFAEKLQNHTLTVTPASEVPGLNYKANIVVTPTSDTESFSVNQEVAQKNPHTIIVGGPTGYMVNW